MQRYLLDDISTDLEKKMVFLSGPRQVGKTTLAKSLLPCVNEKAGSDDPGFRGVYLNWDRSADRRIRRTRNVRTNRNGRA